MCGLAVAVLQTQVNVLAFRAAPVAADAVNSAGPADAGFIEAFAHNGAYLRIRVADDGRVAVYIQQTAVLKLPQASEQEAAA